MCGVATIFRFDELKEGMYHFFKRLSDLLLAACMLVIVIPILLILLIFGAIVFKGKPLFLQDRIGFQSLSFQLIKFRSMKDLFDQDGNLLAEHLRRSAYGQFIRRTGLDELPQLLHIISGKMSFVGPRPLLVEYLPLYSEIQNRRHEVKPGVTGWSQINGRNNQSWKDKLSKDVWYVDHVSFLLDLRILFLTIGLVLSGNGLTYANSGSVPRFNGKN